MLVHEEKDINMHLIHLDCAETHRKQLTKIE